MAVDLDGRLLVRPVTRSLCEGRGPTPAPRYDPRVPQEPLDLRHLGRERVIGAYLVETEDGPALFDCGPASCVDELKSRLAEMEKAASLIGQAMLRP